MHLAYSKFYVFMNKKTYRSCFSMTLVLSALDQKNNHLIELIPNRDIHLETKIASHIKYTHSTSCFIHWTIF